MAKVRLSMTVCTSHMSIYTHFILTDAREVEYAVFRDVAGESEVADALYQWLEAVVHTAVAERRNVRVSATCILLSQ